MNDTPADRLRRARAAKYRTIPEACYAHGWKVSTYTHHENGTRGFKPAQARIYARAFGVSASELLGLRLDSASISEVDVVGDAAVGVWREGRSDNVRGARKRKLVPVPRASSESGLRQAVRVVDESANQVIGRGEFAVFETQTDEVLQAGLVYLIERTRGDLTEKSLRRLVERATGQMHLETPTDDRSLYGEIPYPPSRAEETIRIIGRVIGKYVSFD